ncbi:hypothetical protein [Oceanobacillus sp. CFH 90083]|uniref:hypothetical protein n=1 Tax=Oceanobacillus sp. CFH 90083 TaxID=2592336 RepID=UPI0018844E28|nr:hypothetical protein [Oceanobacillus sp. CFH 90083]
MIWMNFIENRISTLAIICLILCIVIPTAIYWMNKKYHESADPGWKKKRKEQEKQKDKV